MIGVADFAFKPGVLVISYLSPVCCVTSVADLACEPGVLCDKCC